MLSATIPAVHPHPSEPSLVIDRADANDDVEMQDIGHGGGRDETPDDFDPCVFDEMSMSQNLRECARNVQSRHPQLNLLMSYSAGAAFDAGGMERQHAINFHATAYDTIGFNVSFDAPSLPELADMVCRRYAEVLAIRQPAPRFTVEQRRGPDGSDLYAVLDATKDEPDNLVDYRSAHPRMSGRLAKAQAEELAAELNRDAAEATGEFVVPALATGGAA